MKVDFDQGFKFGVDFNYGALVTLLAESFGRFDVRAIEDEWLCFLDEKSKTIWRHEDQSDVWTQSMAPSADLKVILRKRSPFGVLLPLSIEDQEVAEPPYICFYFSKNGSKSTPWASFTFTCDYSIRNADLTPYKTKSLGIRGFYADGEKFRYQRQQFYSFFDAIGNIGRPKQGDDDDSEPQTTKWQDQVNVILENEFGNLSNEEKRQGTLPPLFTGCYLRATRDVLLRPEHPELETDAKIFLLLTRANKGLNAYTHDIFFQIGDNGRCVSLESCLPVIYQRIDKSALENQLSLLARKAKKEDWSYGDIPYANLKYYLKAVFDHLVKEDESRINTGVTDDHIRPFVHLNDKGKDELFFCTGLVTEEGYYIYAHCQEMQDGRYQSVEWLSHSDDEDGNFAVNPTLNLLDTKDKTNHGLPYPPNWVSDPKHLLFEYRFGSWRDGDIGFWEPHIHENLLSNRLPPNIQAKFSNEYPIEQSEKFKEFLRRAWSKTRKYLQQNFKNAIPTYYMGQIQLLVPLFLDEANEWKASAALVLTLLDKDSDKSAHGKEHPYHYYCPTVLSLDMARRNSRVISRISDTWLNG